MLHDAARRDLVSVLTTIVGSDATKRILTGAKALELTCGRPRGVTLDDVVREAIGQFVISASGEHKANPVPYVLTIVRRFLRPGELAALWEGSGQKAFSDPFAKLAKKAESW